MKSEAKSTPDRSDWLEVLRGARKDVRDGRAILLYPAGLFIVIAAFTLAQGMTLGLTWYMALYVIVGAAGSVALAIGSWSRPVLTFKIAKMLAYPLATGCAAFVVVAAFRGLGLKEILAMALPCGGLIASAATIARAENSAMIVESPEEAEAYFDDARGEIRASEEG